MLIECSLRRLRRQTAGGGEGACGEEEDGDRRAQVRRLEVRRERGETVRLWRETEETLVTTRKWWGPSREGETVSYQVRWSPGRRRSQPQPPSPGPFAAGILHYPAASSGVERQKAATPNLAACRLEGEWSSSSSELETTSSCAKGGPMRSW